MVTTLQGKAWAKGRITRIILARATGLGAIGGLLGMLLVDLILMGTLFIAGFQPLICFATVGNTVARFFSLLGIEMSGGVPMGVATHYLVGPALGAIFGAAVTKVGVLQVGILKKYVVLAVLYGLIVSQPLFAMIPLLMKMAASETLLWFVGSLVMHFIWGVILGVVVSYGLQSVAGSSHR